jgi:hypothetical protein
MVNFHLACQFSGPPRLPLATTAGVICYTLTRRIMSTEIISRAPAGCAEDVGEHRDGPSWTYAIGETDERHWPRGSTPMFSVSCPAGPVEVNAKKEPKAEHQSPSSIVSATQSDGLKVAESSRSWTVKQDAMLRQVVKNHDGHIEWPTIAKSFPGRTGKQVHCQQECPAVNFRL